MSTMDKNPTFPFWKLSAFFCRLEISEVLLYLMLTPNVERLSARRASATNAIIGIAVYWRKSLFQLGFLKLTTIIIGT